ncbi:2-nitropropane dioxygenase [Gonapodya prolifera JEL478]|uniref:2-nitropropane dioxygenase n=1 Tax=Gonapodya prolifera (strain JEL478) TaxID=1344416 RepID=A0A139AZR6_GONPJ|nr:2-nitropropane dioxygenase [Gonapodya prolifera JEL478]|eukprot:KXS22190.1 2-nitropropane dioxygenase [Gonapodya prolifera JEL478]
MSTAPAETLATPLTKLLRIKYPILLAGMGAVSGPELAAAVTKAGGLGVMGGIRWSPEALKSAIKKLKEELNDENAAFGVDLLLPAIGGSARKTNYDYTKGQLPALVDIMIEEKCRLFVCAVGVPPKWVVDKLHAAGILVMNMVGAPKHALKALAVGVDAICAQGGEAGGHTGDIATAILVPAVVNVCRGKKSPLTGQQVSVVAAGGIYDGRGLAMALCMGAEAVWVGTRFVAAAEANSSPRHKRAIVQGDYTDTVRTLIFSGRPMRVIKTPYIENWEVNRQPDIAGLTSKGLIPYEWEMDEKQKKGEEVSTEVVIQSTRMLAGQVIGAIDSVKPAAEIVNEMVTDCVSALRTAGSKIVPVPKL